MQHVSNEDIVDNRLFMATEVAVEIEFAETSVQLFNWFPVELFFCNDDIKVKGDSFLKTSSRVVNNLLVVN